MEALRNRPLFSKVYEDPGQFRPDKGSAYIYGLLEERSEHITAWTSDPKLDVKVLRITDQNSNSASVDFDGGRDLPLRNKEALSQFLKELNCDRIYIDITGLSHHIWAPLVRVAIEGRYNLTSIYVEPDSYQANANPRKGEIFDLSESIEGISPIPLFANLTEAPADHICFVPLLGFEGTRFAHMIEQVEPQGGKIVPIVGVPGFQIEFPFFTYLGNQPQLSETQAWKNVRFARANCPFSLYYVLEDVLRSNPNDHIKIAPIGTKPHGLGAVLLAVTSFRNVELIYDHPKRKPKRTSGKQKLMEYLISDFPPAAELRRS